MEYLVDKEGYICISAIWICRMARIRERERGATS